MYIYTCKCILNIKLSELFSIVQGTFDNNIVLQHEFLLET